MNEQLAIDIELDPTAALIGSVPKNVRSGIASFEPKPSQAGSFIQGDLVIQFNWDPDVDGALPVVPKVQIGTQHYFTVRITVLPEGAYELTLKRQT